MALLSPAAFVQLSEDASHDPDTTPEVSMLEASREEMSKEVPDHVHGLKRVWMDVAYYWDLLIWEPLATMVRFTHLVIIFVPVIVTVPVMWFGGRVKDRHNERSGTVWWFGFLVNSMERAGAAFIKVAPRLQSPWEHILMVIAWPMGCNTTGHLS